MKRILLAILLIFAFCSIGAAEIKGSPDGFRGIKWGDPPSTLGEGTKTKTGKFDSFYTKKRDNLTLGSADLVSITYRFLLDQEFTSVMLEAKGYKNANYLKETMIALFGEPEAGDPNRCLWPDDNAYINYSYFANTDTAYVFLASKKLLDKRSAMEREAIEQGTKEF